MDPAATTQPDGPVRYRIDSGGTRVLVLPATCKSGTHLIVPGNAIATADEVHVTCPACAAIPGIDPHWHFTSSGPTPDRAELDDQPYGDLTRLPALRR